MINDLPQPGYPWGFQTWYNVSLKRCSSCPWYPTLLKVFILKKNPLQLKLLLLTALWISFMESGWMWMLIGVNYEECNIHDDFIKWKHFPRYWPFVRGIYRSPVNSPPKGQWRIALVFSLICSLNKRLSKQSWGWWFETLSSSLWCHCNGKDLVETNYNQMLNSIASRLLHIQASSLNGQTSQQAIRTLVHFIISR